MLSVKTSLSLFFLLALRLLCTPLRLLAAACSRFHFLLLQYFQETLLRYLVFAVVWHAIVSVAGFVVYVVVVVPVSP